MSKPTLGYWSIRGYGQPIRFMLAYLGVDYEDKMYFDYETRDDWYAAKFNLGLAFPNLPYWIEGDVRLTETKAIMRYLAREKGQGKNLIPSDPVSTREMDMVENVIFDTWPLLVAVCYGNTEAEKEAFKTQAPVKYDMFSKFLGNKKFLIGDQLTYVDFAFYELLLYYTTYDANYLKPYPNLAEYMKRFAAIPEIVAYNNSPKNVAKGFTGSKVIIPVGW